MSLSVNSRWIASYEAFGNERVALLHVCMSGLKTDQPTPGAI